MKRQVSNQNMKNNNVSKIQKVKNEKIENIDNIQECRIKFIGKKVSKREEIEPFYLK